jgi:hypothetical protein
MKRAQQRKEKGRLLDTQSMKQRCILEYLPTYQDKVGHRIPEVRLVDEL